MFFSSRTFVINTRSPTALLGRIHSKGHASENGTERGTQQRGK